MGDERDDRPMTLEEALERDPIAQAMIRSRSRTEGEKRRDRLLDLVHYLEQCGDPATLHNPEMLIADLKAELGET